MYSIISYEFIFLLENKSKFFSDVFIGVAVSQVLDMRDPEFEVSSVRESDVIHANKKDVNCIFRVTTSLMDPPGVRHQCLMLADTESEKTKWVVALNELHRQVTFKIG